MQRKTLRRVLKTVAGGALLLAGLPLLLLPGPGVPLVLGGLAILATEFEAARKLQRRMARAWLAWRARRRQS